MGQVRAVVTGMGVISSIGLDVATFMESVRNGESGIRPVRAFDTSHFRSHLAGEIQDFVPEEHLSPSEISEYADRYLLLALAAARQALLSSGFQPDGDRKERIAISAGTCNGGLLTAERRYRMLLSGDNTAFDERMAQLIEYGTLGRALAGVLRIRGPNLVVTTACSSSTSSIGIALDLIQSQECDVVLAGGSDSLSLTTYSGFSALKAMAPSVPCSPFSGRPGEYGMNLGEGAGFWVIESLEHALARGAKIFGEVLGYSLSGDAYHLTSPDPRGDGAFRAMRMTLERAGIRPDELGAINAHGTGTEANDRTETRAIRRLMESADAVPVSSVKSTLGHCLGAAGILEASASLGGMEEDFVPPTVHFTEPRPGCELDHVPNLPRQHTHRTFLSNGFAFSGNNAAVVVAKYEPDKCPPDPPRREVVITGTGAISALGIGVDSLVEGVAKGRLGIRRIDRFDTLDCNAHQAGMVEEFDWKPYARRFDLRAMNLISRYATLSALEALKQAGCRLNPRTLEQTGLVLGVTTGPSAEKLMETVWGSEDHAPDITNFSESVANSINGYVSKTLYLKGYNTMVSTGPQAAVSALVLGSRAIQAGHCRTLLVGGADEVFHRHFADLDSLCHLTEDEEGWNQVTENGDHPRMVLGEGATMLVMEDREQAENRGVEPMAEVLGWAETMDPIDLASGVTDSDSLTSAIRLALDRGECSIDDVDAIVTAPMGQSPDHREVEAYRAVFGDDGIPQTFQIVGNTGYCESCSATMAAVAHLNGSRARVGAHLLVVGTSYKGGNHVVLLKVLAPSSYRNLVSDSV